MYYKKLTIFIAMVIIVSPLNAYYCIAASVPTQAALTVTAITIKQQEVLDEYEKYKTALESKKNDMIELLRTVKKIEALMIANQVKRKKILKSWQDRADMYAMPQP